MTGTDRLFCPTLLRLPVLVGCAVYLEMNQAAAASKLPDEKVSSLTHLTASHVKCLHCSVVICTCCFSVLLRRNGCCFENEVLGRIFGSEREEVTGGLLKITQ